jgi:hypothetical protein
VLTELTEKEIVAILRGYGKADYLGIFDANKLRATATKLNNTKILKKIFKAQLQAILEYNRFLNANNYTDIALIDAQDEAPIEKIASSNRTHRIALKGSAQSYNTTQFLLGLIHRDLTIVHDPAFSLYSVPPEIQAVVIPQIPLSFYHEQLRLYRAFKPHEPKHIIL